MIEPVAETRVAENHSASATGTSLIACRTCLIEKAIKDFRPNRRSCRSCTNEDAKNRMYRLYRKCGRQLISEMKRPWIYKGMPFRGKYALGEDGYRSCTECDQRKHRSEFYASKKRHGGIGTVCKLCSCKIDKAYRMKNQPTLSLRRYGLTLAKYDEMLAAQGGRCAICRTSDPKGNGRFCVDHNHKTNVVRALLCNPCNWGIGQFHENLDIMSAAISYLKQHAVTVPETPGQQ